MEFDPVAIFFEGVDAGALLPVPSVAKLVGQKPVRARPWIYTTLGHALNRYRPGVSGIAFDLDWHYLFESEDNECECDGKLFHFMFRQNV